MCIRDRNGGGYTQRAVENGLKVPCLFMITEVSMRCQKKPGGWYTPYTRVYPPNTPLGGHVHRSPPRGDATAQQQTRRSGVCRPSDGTDGRTDGRTPDRFIDPAPHAVRAASMK